MRQRFGAQGARNMATLIFLFSIVTNPATAQAAQDAVDNAPQAEQSMRYYGVEQLLAKFEREA
jgi:hypothetical protein